eukprot:scaffold637_cov97-Skeletonema_dohrnii-CCMP3373.AAC.8
MVSSPTTRRTRSRINAAATTNSPSGKNDDKTRVSAAAAKMKKNAASPSTANEEEPLIKMAAATAMEMDESTKNNVVKNNAAINNSAESKGGTNNKELESRNDAPAKATFAAANNDATSTDNTEASTDASSSSADSSSVPPINHEGGAMEVEDAATVVGEASTNSEIMGEQQQQPSGEKLFSEAAAPVNNADGKNTLGSKAELDSNIAEQPVALQKEIDVLGGEESSASSKQQLEHQHEGKTAQNKHTVKSESTTVIATANKIAKVTTEVLPPSNAAATAAATASKLTSEQQSPNTANATTTSSNNNNNATTSENSSSSSSPNSFSMTLAIGPSDTQRLFMASKTFNEEIQKLRRIKENGTQIVHGGVGGGGAPPTTTTTDKEGALEKKRKADSDTHISDNTSTSDNTAAAAAAVVQSSPSSPSMVVSSNGATSTTMTPSSKTTASTTLSTQDQIALLVSAAKSTSNPLLSSFMSKMKYKSTEEQETSLLFFLDADKSTKLLMAFDVLSDTKKVEVDNQENKGGAAAVVSSTVTKDKGVNDTLAAMAIHDNNGVDESKVLSRRGLTLLFQSFLTSISTCVHNKNENGKSSSLSSSSPQEENKSPNNSAAGGSGGDWTGSEKTAKEISEVAIFAANHLIEYAKKEEEQGGSGKLSVGGGDPCVSFDQFGKWYNSGGFSLVPWLELLDLSKWDYTLKTNNKNVAIEQVPLGGGEAAMTAAATTTA